MSYVNLQLELAFGGIESQTFCCGHLEALLAIIKATFASSVVLDSK